jgi:hypothetical protein
MGKVYVNEKGIKIICNCNNDISNATNYGIRVKKPDGTTDEWDAEIVEGTKLVHKTVEGDLDQAGTYKVQPKLDIPDVELVDGKGDTGTFVIYNDFE